MEKFGFLLDDWNLEYQIPESRFSKACTGSGSGTFKKALDDKYVFFDYDGMTRRAFTATGGSKARETVRLLTAILSTTTRYL